MLSEAYSRCMVRGGFDHDVLEHYTSEDETGIMALDNTLLLGFALNNKRYTWLLWGWQYKLLSGSDRIHSYVANYMTTYFCET